MKDKKMKEKCTVLVGSCDAYFDLWDPFFDLFKRFWPDNEFDIVLSTESSNYKRKDLEIININPSNPNFSWSRRMAETLEKIETNQVILILDDFFLIDYVNTKEVNKTINWLDEDPNIATFTFWPIASDGKISEKYPGYEKRPKIAKYKVAAILGVWNKKKLLKYLKGYDENAWEWEQNAIKRSNTLYTEDKFYVTQSNDDQVFPYDFTKIGLFAGQWFKETPEVLNKLGIDINYEQRGFYEPALRGLQNSITSVFELDSKVIPWYELEKSAMFLNNTQQNYEKEFKQTYLISGSSQLIRWEPATQWGFGIDNFNIKIVYKDCHIDYLDDLSIFGNFTKINDRIIFNTVQPNLYIHTKKTKKIQEITISGKLVMPLTKKELIASHDEITKPLTLDEKNLYNSFWNQYLTLEEKVVHIKLDSKFIINKKEIYKPELLVKEGNFSQEYFVENLKEFSWIPSSSGGYSIKGLKIYIYFNNKKREITKEVQNLSLTINKTNVFFSDTPITWSNVLEEKIEKVVIKGEMVKPVEVKILRKLLYPKIYEKLYFKIVNKFKRIWHKFWRNI